MIKKLIDQIGGRERLESIVYAMGAEPCDADPILDSVTHGDIGKMARALLAVLDAKPVGTVSIVQDLYSIPRRNIATVNMRPDLVLSEMRDGDNLYTVPPAASATDVTFDPAEPGSEATVITHYATPAGWKLVPVVASPSQRAAGHKAFDAAGINKIDAVYRAMVEAAPEYNK